MDGYLWQGGRTPYIPAAGWPSRVQNRFGLALSIGNIKQVELRIPETKHLAFAGDLSEYKRPRKWFQASLVTWLGEDNILVWRDMRMSMQDTPPHCTVHIIHAYTYVHLCNHGQTMYSTYVCTCMMYGTYLSNILHYPLCQK